jgi:prepilin-type processing-associated H-X9-DG protein
MTGIARAFVLALQSRPRDIDPESFLSSASRKSMRPGEIAASIDLIRSYLETPEYTVQEAGEGTAAEVTMDPRPRRVRIRLVSEGGEWRVDLPGTLEALRSEYPDDFAVWHERWQSQVCRDNLRNLGISLMLYAADYGERFPTAANWCSGAWRYIEHRDAEMIECPASAEPYAYAFNAYLSHRHLGAVADPAGTVMLFESSLGLKDAADHGESLCDPPRHPGGNNFGYVDGHAAAQTTPQQFALAGR